jgi:hypothetical protein
MIPARLPQPTPPPTPIMLAKLLLVEGSTPTHFFEALLRHLGLAQQIEIRDYGGVRDLTHALNGLVMTADFKRLVTSVGVVRDAEDRPAAAARAAAEGALATAGLLAPGSSVQTSIFVLPNNADPGMIETLCMKAVENEAPLAIPFACVQDFFACLRNAGIQLPADIRFAKHHAQAFLATRPEVQLFPGLAAYRGYWPWDNPTFDDLKNFLQAI